MEQGAADEVSGDCGRAAADDATRSAAVRNIVLTGFMGSGKTTVGRILAQRLERRFVDTDAVIESRHGAISRIVSQDGWSVFRAMERDVARDLAGSSGLVISTGGRLMLDSECAVRLEPGSDVVWLKADPAAIVARVVHAPGADPSKRPLLIANNADPCEMVEKLLAERIDVYDRYRSVDTTDLSPDEAADAVLSLLGMEAVRETGNDTGSYGSTGRVVHE